ncbi:MAG: Rieske 2Fe-2S domain-containing protein [Ktedonobacterales bacterium]|nr:Rieske 2Fe-2S domain-containing protein [Ktedonobacterales bacterium]
MLDDNSSGQDPTISETAQTAATPSRAPFSERLSDTLQHGVAALVGANRKPPRRLKSWLNGTWLGHPLHPVITDVPIAAWVLTALFDILWLMAPHANSWAIRGAEAAAIVGVLAALGAFATGATDWSDTYGAERSTGLIHGLLMTTAILLYGISSGLRLAVPSGQSILAALVGFGGLVVVSVGAYFGGHLVFRFATGVNHTVSEPFVEHFEPVIALADLPENTLRRVVASGAPVVLLRLGERISAIGATCTHAGGPLDEGTPQGDVVQCPWHSSRFRMRDGHVLTGPATIAAPRYDVRVRDGQVEVKRNGSH